MPRTRPAKAPAGQGEYHGETHNTGVDIYALVDSWRSYSTDATNLQSTTSNTANLNATAPAFEPSLSQSTAVTGHKPYEKLRSVHSYARYPSYRVDKSYRVSNGTAERKIVEANNAAQSQTKIKRKKKSAVSSVPQIDLTRQIPVRTTRATADTPLPSIEQGDANLSGLAKQAKLPFRYATPRETRTKSPEAPVASPEYCAAAQRQPVKLAESRKLLVILDLNGTLLHRNQARTSINVRPGVSPFVDYIFNNHTVMVYTSATPWKAEEMVNAFLHPSHRNKLAGVWARDKLDLTQVQYRNKVQVYKKLDKVWNDPTIQQTAEPSKKWDQSNTILIDDSRLKALSQPFNLLQVAEYTKDDNPRKGDQVDAIAYKAQLDIMQDLQLKIEELKYQEDVSRLIRQWQVSEPEISKSVNTVPVWTAVNQEASELRKVEPLVKAHLPTPDSLVDEIEGGVCLSEKKSDRERSGSASSIDEDVFRELLEGTGK